jgi:uncharacterized membrane protein YvbJ
MVYCTKCDTQNPDDAVNCSKCGALLREAPYREYRRYRYESEWYSSSRSHIWSIMIGLFIILIGVASLSGWNIWDKILPAFIILVGLIIIASAITRRH